MSLLRLSHAFQQTSARHFRMSVHPRAGRHAQVVLGVTALPPGSPAGMWTS